MTIYKATKKKHPTERMTLKEFFSSHSGYSHKGKNHLGWCYKNHFVTLDEMVDVERESGASYVRCPAPNCNSCLIARKEDEVKKEYELEVIPNA